MSSNIFAASRIEKKDDDDDEALPFSPGDASSGAFWAEGLGLGPLDFGAGVGALS
eukprot:CAMPEP_0206513284 /NCGR_PEP_ID=MMETSP0324_2-20121206/61413_1 /ASSEMBLY_ACC=CAM_ASM_000836 /TAXON_ID=2866 /ORGANISM="Crypthecodinium cohnii, Strain Seligo" /LENGTH=54 /DNA_ID=CAMNT_0054005463 /DNA_START=491 /DNA_END=655 /DNA_ORIENTATION=-